MRSLLNKETSTDNGTPAHKPGFPWNKVVVCVCILYIAVFLGYKGLQAYLEKSITQEEIEAAFKPISSKYGIRIAYAVGDDFFTPLKNPVGPAGPHLDSQVKPIRHRVLMRYPIRLQKALNKYPADVIKNCLKVIYFAGEIDHDGRKYGGTYDIYRLIIYLADNGQKNDAQAMGTFHHEFSSLLMRSHPFRTNPWTDQNPKGFRYLDDRYDNWKTVQEVRKTYTKEDCYKNGIVTNYGLTGFENDLNEYSKMIFTYPQKFIQIMDKYQRVRDKFQLWLKFYQSIDPIFTEEYLFGRGGQ